MSEEKYDVVLDVLQKHHDKLWNMTSRNEQWGLMDQIRLEQMETLKDAMEIWKKYKPQDEE
jgi:hypothetical protein